MLKRILSIFAVTSLAVLGLAAPAHAQTYDFAVTASAVSDTANIPNVITWTINVASVGDDMGAGAGQFGKVEFTAPASISLVISSDCDVSGNDVVCSWEVSDTEDASFDVHGFVSLTALGAITVTPTFTENEPRTDSNSANDSDEAICTAVTSILVLC